MKHFIIITGFPNSKSKLKKLLEFSQFVKRKYDNATLCYTTHYPPVLEIYKNFDFVIFNKYNPIVNWDLFLNDGRFQFAVKILYKEHTILYPQPYHGYAHHISICDAISQAYDQEYDFVTIINSDARSECIDMISHHIHKFKSGSNYFYHYGKNKNGINTEFFSINRSFLQFFYSFRNFDTYTKFKSVHYEENMKSIVSEYLKNNKNDVFIDTSPFSDDVFGIDNFDDVDKVKLDDKYFHPHHIKNGIDYFYIPYYDNDEKYFIFISPDDTVKCKLNNKFVTDLITPIKKDLNFLKIYENDKIFKHIKLHDKRQYGLMHRNTQFKTVKN